MVLNRLMDPFSKYRIFRQWTQTVYAQGLDEIQPPIPPTLDLDLVFYDTASSCFEGEETDDLAQYGYSKDHRRATI